MAESFAVPLTKAIEPFVLALDVGSTGTRGGLFDATGRPIARTRIKVDHAFHTNAEGRSEISPDQVVHEVAAVLDAVARPEFAGRIGGVAMDTFASSLVGVDEDDAAVTPCYTYADTRCRREVDELRKLLDEDELQQRTGARLHSSYLPGRLRWLRRVEPDTFELTRWWMSLGEYVQLRLLGVHGVALSTASWGGLVNRQTLDWDEELLDLLGLHDEHCNPIRLPGQPFAKIPRRIARRWPGLAGAVWFPSIPDGLASNLGPGATDERTMSISASGSGAVRVLGKAITDRVPSGLWCYRVDRERSLIGGTLSDVGHVVSWLDTVTPIPTRGNRNDWFSNAPTADTPVVLPFLTGERSTGWRGDARAIVADIGPGTNAAEFYRGAMDGVALSYRRVVEQLDEVAPGIERIVAAGAIAQLLPAWLSVVANALDKPLLPINLKRTTLRGSALMALETLAPDVPRAEPEAGDIITPTRSWVREYDKRYVRFLDLYASNFG
ncbi:MAG: gluconokinase [Actinomycetota bacterium]